MFGCTRVKCLRATCISAASVQFIAQLKVVVTAAVVITPLSHCDRLSWELPHSTADTASQNKWQGYLKHVHTYL